MAIRAIVKKNLILDAGYLKKEVKRKKENLKSLIADYADNADFGYFSPRRKEGHEDNQISNVELSITNIEVRKIHHK